MDNSNLTHKVDLPPLNKLGPDLQRIAPWRRFLTLALPFFWCGAYFGLAILGFWPLAILALVALSFVTYGSTSHDLVHCSLGLPRKMNDVLLCVIEGLALRSGHAYQAAHLHHHARYPHEDDVEAQSARGTLLAALEDGIVFQFRIWLWALKNAKGARGWVVGEGLACVFLVALSIGLVSVTPIFLVYVVLMIMGSWIIPLVTSYIPHNPCAENELFQTRVFRGVVASVLTLGHLYHLEHHLYPSVPHHNWPKLARSLDPYLIQAGVTPIRFWL